MTTPPAPDGERGPRDHDLPQRALSDRAAAYVAESALTDKGARFEQRLGAVTAERSRRRRVAVIALVTGTIAGMVVLGWIGWEVRGAPGLFAGVAVADLLVVGWFATQRVLAQTRGSSAWSWQTQRYSAIGNPSKEVQKLDEPDRDR